MCSRVERRRPSPGRFGRGPAGEQKVRRDNTLSHRDVLPGWKVDVSPPSTDDAEMREVAPFILLACPLLAGVSPRLGVNLH